jgi:hypothetical protein
MPASVRTRILAVLAAAVLGAVAVPRPAAADPSPAACGGPTGSASADLLRVDAAQAPAGLRIASAHAGVAAGRATAGATAATPLALPAALAPTTGSTQVRSRAVDLGVARVGTGDLRARAACPSAQASATMLDATVLPGLGGISVLRVPGNLNSAATVDGSATARVGLTDLRVFDGTTGRVAVKVLTEPTLTVTGGTHASVRYTAPVLEVTSPGGRVRRLDAPGEYVDLALSDAGTVSVSGPQRSVTESLPGNPRLPATGTLRISLGQLNRHQDGADVASVRVRVLGSGRTLLDIGVGVLSADAAEAPGTGTLPLTGVNAGWLVGLGLLIAIAGRFLLVISKRRASAEV